MFAGRVIFKQLMDFMPLPTFRRCVAKYKGDFKVKTFSCLDQFLCMTFAQITHQESLRDIEICLRSQNKKLYHMGIRGKVSKSTLADANKKRDWRIYAEVAQSLIAISLSIDAEANAVAFPRFRIYLGMTGSIFNFSFWLIKQLITQHFPIDFKTTVLY